MFHTGARTKLKGFKRFLGGLDSDRDLTGETTVFTEHMGLEMMFHVATLLPFSPSDVQQVGLYILVYTCVYLYDVYWTSMSFIP